MLATEPRTVVEPSGKGRWVKWIALISLAAIVATVFVDSDLRALMRGTGHEIMHISPLFLLAFVGIKVAQAIFSAMIWRNLLAAAFPEHPLSLRYVIGIDQGQDVLNAVTPVRAGTWTMLGIFEFSIPGAHVPTIVAVWAVRSIAFSFFALVNYIFLGISLPGQTGSRAGMMDRVIGFTKGDPLLLGLAAAIIVGAVIAAGFFFRRKISRLKEQFHAGVAILETPSRYIQLVFLPSLAAYFCRIAGMAVLFLAFGIPVSIWTIALAIGSHAVAGAVRVTPGGVGTTQAIDVFALSDYAPANVVTAYSLTETALNTMISLSVTLVALVSLHGWSGTRDLIRHRDHLAAGLHTMAERERALGQRVLTPARPKQSALPEA